VSGGFPSNSSTPLEKKIGKIFSPLIRPPVSVLLSGAASQFYNLFFFEKKNSLKILKKNYKEKEKFSCRG